MDQNTEYIVSLIAILIGSLLVLKLLLNFYDMTRGKD